MRGIHGGSVGESAVERPGKVTDWGSGALPLAPKALGFNKKSPEQSGLFSGATHQARTDDLRVTNALLYRLS